MEQKITKKPFNKRAFISVAMLVSGIALPVSGIMNHNLQFSLFTPERHFWMSVHNVSALLFTIFAITHIIFNRKALNAYLNKVKGIALSKEAITAIVLVLFIVFAVSSHAFHVR